MLAGTIVKRRCLPLLSLLFTLFFVIYHVQTRGRKKPPKKFYNVPPLPAVCPEGHKCIAAATKLFDSQQLWQVDAYAGPRRCPHHHYNCTWISNVTSAHALIFHGRDLTDSKPWVSRRRANPNQHWVYFSQECPRSVAKYGYDIYDDSGWRFLFNSTATYRTDADFFVPYGFLLKRKSPAPTLPVSLTRKRLAYAVISNCIFDTGRLKMLRQLAAHMDLAIFGRCGEPFPYPDFKTASKDFYFYMAFENSRCKDYITEKFWSNALDSGTVPVVLGARREDYLRTAPPNSFIFAEDFHNAESLASFLKKVASNAGIYKRYFDWKDNYTITFDFKSAFMCHLCRKLHNEFHKSHLVDLRVSWTLSDCIGES